jgi:general L-amino acid transport system permease protein
MEYPALRGPNVQGGFQLTIGFISLFLGLTLYTAAFIAEIVRAGIQAVPYGQIEAARSQGLSGAQVLNLVVLPQALRLIIPPLGNQYVNLGKNSSLGLIVNYVDTYRIAQIANNESGQAVPFFVGLMVIYLSLSLTLSLLTNLVNRTTQIRVR